jgi:hypothetical protein
VLAACQVASTGEDSFRTVGYVGSGFYMNGIDSEPLNFSLVALLRCRHNTQHMIQLTYRLL